MVDIKKIHEKLQLPVIGVTYQDSTGIETAIKKHFSDPAEKIEEYKKLGQRDKITLKTSHDIFVRKEGCTLSETTQLLNTLTIQGSLPEPIRVAQLLAKTLLKN